jgi:hypothetical protein
MAKAFKPALSFVLIEITIVIQRWMAFEVAFLKKMLGPI